MMLNVSIIEGTLKHKGRVFFDYYHMMSPVTFCQIVI